MSRPVCPKCPQVAAMSEQIDPCDIIQYLLDAIPGEPQDCDWWQDDLRHALKQQDALEQIKQGKCPFGYLKDGESIAHCPLGFPGCNCADEMEQSAEFELADLEAENATLRGAMAADDERLRLAGERVGCDTAEWMADEIEALRARIATLDEALKRVYSLVTFQLAEPPNDTGALVEIATVIETVPGIAERGGL